MNCQNHPEISAMAYCRACGKPLCDDCRREAAGTIYCDEHVPAQAATPPPASGYTRPPYTPPYPPPPAAYATTNVSPALAFFLGVIPGVGAIYNGQYAKGLVHAVVWGVLMSIADSNAVHGLEPVFVMLVIAWWAYMALEAHRTAQRLAVRRGGGRVLQHSGSALGGELSPGRGGIDRARGVAAAAHPRPARFRESGAILAGAADCGGRLYAVVAPESARRRATRGAS